LIDKIGIVITGSISLPAVDQSITEWHSGAVVGDACP
jgi:hypothetical protein